MREFLLVTILALLLVGAGCQTKSSGDTYPQPRIGSVATFQIYPHWRIIGSVRVVDSRTLRFHNFYFHGDGLRAEIRLQKNDARVATLKDIRTMTYDDATFDLALPDNITLDDFNLVTVFAPDMGAPVSGAVFSK